MIIRVTEAANGTAVEEGGSGHFLAVMSTQGAADSFPQLGEGWKLALGMSSSLQSPVWLLEGNTMRAKATDPFSSESGKRLSQTMSPRGWEGTEKGVWSRRVLVRPLPFPAPQLPNNAGVSPTVGTSVSRGSAFCLGTAPVLECFPMRG